MSESSLENAVLDRHRFYEIKLIRKLINLIRQYVDKKQRLIDKK